jgi:hypothetical protein
VFSIRRRQGVVSFVAAGMFLGCLFATSTPCAGQAALGPHSTQANTESEAARKAAEDSKPKNKVAPEVKPDGEPKTAEPPRSGVPQESDSLKIENFWSNPSKIGKPAKIRDRTEGGADAGEPTFSITLHVIGISKLAKTGDYTATKLIPFINGVPIGEVHLDYVDLESEQMRFRFTLTDKTLPDWTDLLGLEARRVTLGIGWNVSGQKVMAANKLVIRAATWPRLIAFISISIVIVLSVVILGRRTALLRDRPEPVANDGTAFGASSSETKATFSLARAQMAWWLVISAISFLYLWAVLDKWTFNAKVLTLLGISGATGLSSVLIDSGKQKSAAGELDLALADKALKAREFAVTDAELSRLRDDEATNRLAVVAEQANQERLRLIDKRIETLKREAGPASTTLGFIRDLLSDKDGISLHRYQLVVWSIVLGVLFVYKVYTTLQIPLIDDTLLTLMGISGGLYLGFKWPDPKK